MLPRHLHACAMAVSLAVVLALPSAAQVIRVESYQGTEVAAGEVLVRFRDTGVFQSLVIAAQDPDIVASEPVGRTGAVLLRSRNRSAAELLQTYGSRLDVEYAEPNHVWHAFDQPNDVLFSRQWGLLNQGQLIGTQTGFVGADIKAPQAWDITEGTRDFAIAVVDTGIDYAHPDLAPNIWSAPSPFAVTIGGQTITCAEGTHGFNAITRTCDPMDDFGHGTHVAGILGAAGNNGAGISGVSRIANIIGVKFLSATGSGTTADAVAALEFVAQVKQRFPADADIRILNASWGAVGVNFFSRSMMEQIRLLGDADILFVASAGNASGGSNNDITPAYPASFSLPNILAVASTSNRDDLVSSSNWGPASVHLGAPGQDVFSTLPSGVYGFRTGTSMASPMVAGAAALVLSKCSLPTSALKSTLLNSVDATPALAGKTITGGRLNVFTALTDCAGGGPSTGFTITIQPGAQAVQPGGSIDVAVRTTAVGGFSSAIVVSASGVPAGMTASFAPPSVAPGAASTLTLTAGSGVLPGTYEIAVAGTSGSLSRSATLSLEVGPEGPSIAPGQTLSGALANGDDASVERYGKLADYYTLTLTSPTSVTIDLKSTQFDAYLYVRSASGTLLAAEDQSGGGNDARFGTLLQPGEYRIEVTSFGDGETGDYTLSVNTPVVVAVNRRYAPRGSSQDVALTGIRFSSPMTIDAGSGIVVSNVVVTSPTSAFATFSIAPDAPSVPRGVTVATPEGASNPILFLVTPTIEPGVRTDGSLTAGDAPSAESPTSSRQVRYADLYQFSLTTPSTVNLDMRSTAFPPSISVYTSTGERLTSILPSQSMTLDPGVYYIEASSLSSRATGDYSLSINLPGLTSISPRFVAAGETATASLTGSRFMAPMTLAGGEGVSAENVAVASPTSATATLIVAPAAPPGSRDVTVTTSEGVSNASAIRVFESIPSIAPGQTLAGTLSSSDQTLPESSGSYVDLYKLTLPSTTLVTITQESSEFDARLFLLTGSGSVILSNNNSSLDTPNARMTATLGAGTYFVEATSDVPSTGAYSISVSTLVLTSISPRFGARDATVSATLTGAGFAEPMTIDAGLNVSVGTVTVTGSTSATVTLTIAADAALGPRDIRVTMPGGATNALTFTVFEAIAAIGVGETRAGTLAPGDPPSPNRPGRYSDLYRLDVAGSTPIEVVLQSTAFNGYLYLLSATGSVLAQDDNTAGNNNAKLAGVVGAGLYYVEVTSSLPGVGDYSLSLATGAPTLTGITPFTGKQGSNIAVVLSGSGLVGPLAIDAGPGVVIPFPPAPPSPAGAFVTLGIVAVNFTISPNAPVGDRAVTVTSAWGTSNAVTFTITPPSSLNFPRLFSPGDLGLTGFAITNPSSTPADVTFRLYGPQGTLRETVNSTIAAKGQLADLGTEIFQNPMAPGWVQASSNTPGLQGFWVGGDFTTFMDGAEAAPAARELVFQLVTADTELNVVNLSGASNIVAIRVYSLSGAELPLSVTQVIAPNGILRNTVRNFFPTVSFALPTTIRVSGTGALSGTSVTPDYPIGGPSWSVLNGIDAATLTGQLYFPHVASGPEDGSPSWTSILGITNLSSVFQSVTITFTPVSGSPVSISRGISARGILRESMQTLFNFPPTNQEGWVRVTGGAPLSGFIAYGFSETKGTAVVPAMTAPRSSLLFSHVANGPAWSTGIALLNPNSVDVGVEVYVLRETGALVGGAQDVPTASFTLPAGTKQAKFLTDLVPSADADDGFVFVRSTNGPIYGLELFFSRDFRVIANVAASGLEEGIIYTPPAP